MYVALILQMMLHIILSSYCSDTLGENRACIVNERYIFRLKKTIEEK